MSEAATAEDALVFECELDAPPERVWRAISTPELREVWLGEAETAAATVVEAAEGERLVLDLPLDGLESQVTFAIDAGVDGGTRLTIVHRLGGSPANVVAFPARRERPVMTGEMKWAA